MNAPRQETGQMDLTGLFVAVGRLEAKVDIIMGREGRVEERLATLEQAVTELKAQQRPRTPWWVIVGGIAATVTAILGFWTLFNVATDLASLVP